MADIFANIGRTITEPIGNLWQGAYKGLAPGAFQRESLMRDIQKIRAAGGTSTEAGRAMLAEMTGKYKPDMFVSPLEKARTKYLSEGRGGPASDLYEALEFWQKQLRGAVDPEGFGVRKDPKTGKIKGILNRELYDTANENISRITKEIQALSSRTGRGAFGRMGGGATVEPTEEGELGVYEQLAEAQPRRRARLPAADGWAGALGGEDLTGYPKLQAISESRNLKEWQPVPSSDFYKSMSLTQGSLMSKIARMKDTNGVVMGSKRAGDIVKSYSTIANYLVTLKPSEVREIIAAIEDGMTEEEILQFFGNE